MATYQDEILGAQPGVNINTKDAIVQFAETGVVDIYQESLVGGVDYVIGAFGASTGGTMLNPAVLIFDSSGRHIATQLDGGMTGFGGPDPLFTFKAPGLGVGQTETYFIGVFDEAQSGGQYTLSVEPAGPPVFFGSP